MSKEQLVNEIHKPARRNFERQSVVLKGIDDLWQADLADFQSLKTFNKGFSYVLVIIDTFSKFVWTVPIKSKTKSEITNAFKFVIANSSRKPRNLQTDHGREFWNTDFLRLMNSAGINFYSTYSTIKAGFVERVIRTLKNKMYKYFSMTGSYKWIGDPLNNIVSAYNETKHRTTKFKPIDVNKMNENFVLRNILTSRKFKLRKYKKRFSVGDHVRVSKYKSYFEKGYTPNWSTEVFVIKSINNTTPITYHLEDLQKQPVLGSFYEQEISKTLCPNIYLIERIIKKKGNKLLVKWLGLSDSNNSWIDKKTLV